LIQKSDNELNARALTLVEKEKVIPFTWIVGLSLLALYLRAFIVKMDVWFREDAHIANRISSHSCFWELSMMFGVFIHPYPIRNVQASKFMSQALHCLL
jgi:hypothetical protein